MKYHDRGEVCEKHDIVLRKSKYKGKYCPKCVAHLTAKIR